MEFLMPIRNAVTGEEKNFYDLQQMADFLATRTDAADWEGVTAYGPLPEPSPEVVLPVVAQAAAEPAVTADIHSEMDLIASGFDEVIEPAEPTVAEPVAAPVAEVLETSAAVEELQPAAEAPNA